MCNETKSLHGTGVEVGVIDGVEVVFSVLTVGVDVVGSVVSVIVVLTCKQS